MGVTSYYSYRKHAIGKNYIASRILKISVPYLVSIFFYMVVLDGGFDFKSYFLHAINFNVTAPDYYIALFLQLLLVSPVVFIVIRTEVKLRIIIDIAVLIAIYIFSFYIHTIPSSDGRDSWELLTQGSYFLFGGQYIFLLALGMVFAKYKLIPLPSGTNAKSTFRKIVLTAGSFCISLVITLYFAKATIYGDHEDFFILDKFNLFSYNKLNPPGTTQIIYTILIILCIICYSYTVNSISIQGKNPSPIIMKIKKLLHISLCEISDSTLYIFLYHRFFGDYLFGQILGIDFISGFAADGSSLGIFMRVIFVVYLLVLPLLVRHVFQFLWQLLKDYYSNQKNLSF
jgi:hypothetical protein